MPYDCCFKLSLFLNNTYRESKYFADNGSLVSFSIYRILYSSLHQSCNKTKTRTREFRAAQTLRCSMEIPV